MENRCAWTRGEIHQKHIKNESKIHPKIDEKS